MRLEELSAWKSTSLRQDFGLETFWWGFWTIHFPPCYFYHDFLFQNFSQCDRQDIADPKLSHTPTRHHHNTTKMPRRRFIDKKSATTFTLVHRAQDDPRINDDEAPDMVFTEKQAKIRRPTEDDYAYSSAASIFSADSDYRSSKTRQRGDLEEEFGMNVRPNEGEAAQHGIFFDDTQYDYMQHMRDLGAGEGPVAWVEASAPPQRAKRKQKLEDALRDIDLESESGRFVDAQSVGTQSSAARSLLPEEILPSEFVRKRTYQDQQDVPDEIAGLQPDMDPELREALRALDDEEYVDDDEDLFGQLVEDGYEIDRDDFERFGEQAMFEDGEGVLGNEDDGWESDDTIKARDSPPPQLVPSQPPHDASNPEVETIAEPPQNPQDQPPADPTSGAWLDEYKKFNSANKSSHKSEAAKSSLATGPRDASTILSTASSRRSEHQQLLDARFERLIEKEYAGEPGQFDDALSNASGLTGASGVSKVSAVSGYSISSSASRSLRSDFDGIIDDFLDTHSRVGKRGKRVAKVGPQTGMEQLDEVRRGLGTARVKSAARNTR